MKTGFNKRILLIVIFTFIVIPFVYSNEIASTSAVNGSSKYMLWAFILGGLSALSLVLGSILGIIWQPSPRITAAFTAFGAGALLAALSVELIAPTVQEFVGDKNGALLNGTVGHNSYLEFIFLIGGCILGGIAFFLLNEALNSKGGYLRKVSTTISYLNHKKRNRYKIALTRLSKIKLLRSIPPSHMDVLVQHLRHTHIRAGRTLFKKGDTLTKLYLIESGEVETFRDGELIGVLKEGHLVGESAMLTNEQATFNAIALSDLKLFELSFNDFNTIHKSCPELQAIIERESKQELVHDIGSGNGEKGHISAQVWAEKASQQLHRTSYLPNQTEINNEAEKHTSAPLSIWLGIFLDGIPESFVIGAGFLLILSAKASQGIVAFAEVVPYTLIAGLFLSNFPEAMSSSIGMKKMGWRPLKILSLWTSLMIMTALGAVFGYYYGVRIPNYIEIGVEGLAAGAMLTMIAQTMIPEAVHIGGSKITGLSTLAGYLAAVAFKVFE